MDTKRVVGIGQCSWDYLFNIPRYPEPDTKQEITHLSKQGGGPVATALVGLARLGHRCSMHGVLGDDEYGRFIRDSLKREGIDVSGLIAREGAGSQVAFISVEDGSARRTIFWRRPTGMLLMPSELAGDFLSGARLLHLDGLMAEVSLHAARRARELGIPVMLDAGRLRPAMMEIARIADYVVASEEFARELGYDGDADAFLSKISRELGGVFTFTLGAGGSHTVSSGERFHTPAFKVDAIDTTGAGDVFHAGYIHGVLMGWSLRETARFASAMAALKCRGMGGRSAIPTLAEIEALLDAGH